MVDQQQPQTLREANDTLNHKKHMLSTWEALHDYLDKNFIGKDGRQAKAIRSPGAVPEAVPESVIEEILCFIGEGPIAQLTNEITDIESQKVVVIREAKGTA
jgi:hypothetical protein